MGLGGVKGSVRDRVEAGGPAEGRPFWLFFGEIGTPGGNPPPFVGLGSIWGIFVPHDKKKHTPRLLTYPPGTGARVVGGGI